MVLTQYVLKFYVQDIHQQLKESKGWFFVASSFGMLTFPFRKVIPAEAFSDNQERLVSSSIKMATEERTASKSQRNN